MEQDLVGHRERLDHRGALVRDRQQTLVRDDDEGVDLLAQALDALLGLVRAPPALEGERPGDDADRERAEALGRLGDDRGGAGAGAAALAGGDEDHVGALQHLLDLLEVLLGRHAGPTSGSLPAPSPRVKVRPMSSLMSASLINSAWASVLTATNSTPCSPASIMRLTAFTPAPADADHLDHGDEALAWRAHPRSILSLSTQWDHRWSATRTTPAR